MATRNFEEWLGTMNDNIATWKYYTDFEKIYNHIENIKVELNILNSLVGSKNIETDFRKLLHDYPNILKVIPILLAKREEEIMINSPTKNYVFNFKKANYSEDDYVLFMKETGLFDLLQNHLVNNLVDYVLGVEAGMDTNARKNRTGDAMEDLVESFIKAAGLVKDKDYFKEMYKSEVEKKFNVDLSVISNKGKTEKRFDFVIYKNNIVYGIECNYYHKGGGSKLNETARSYKNLALESKDLPYFKFIWFTDGLGWNQARHNLEETFDVLDNLYNIKDLENNILKQMLK